MRAVPPVHPHTQKARLLLTRIADSATDVTSISLSQAQAFTYRRLWLSPIIIMNTLTDVTLACDGQKFSAHKLVLVTCSDYFRSILGDLPCQHPIVYMRGVTAQEMEALIDFMYTGQTDIPQKEVPTLLSTAEALQIKGLGVFNARILNNLSNLLHHPNPESSKSSLPRVASPIPQSPQDRVTSETVSSHTSNATKDSLREKNSCQSSGHPTQYNHRREGKAASPRALNYSLSGLGASKDNLGTSLHGQPSEESSGAHADTAEHLIKTEIKEEALDFSNTTMSENHHSDSSSSAPRTNTIGEETRMYLDAFARSANLTWQQPAEDTVETPVVDGRPFVCPICNKSFAKAAILKRHHLAHFRPYVCHLCPRSFTRREVLAEHILEHTGADLRMPCPVCGMTIKRKRNLQAHIKVKHPDYHQQKIAKKEAMC
ncbi:Longitudinals lacking protein-like [Chionoecetes opilio]|uniref:Longitudinals lacking protein-like n=1 Tax=Chionoecetes opilio TaxID=41210 RepID=A0A8J5CRI8_CHIOP|nr:Longitudinals lacking protein-like [Chionoecetes opilio]